MSPDFFNTVGTRILRDATFDDDEAPGAPLAGIINEMMAKKYFAGRSPIGGTLRLFNSAPVTVVGVVENTVVRTFDEPPAPQLYLSLDRDRQSGLRPHRHRRDAHVRADARGRRGRDAGCPSAAPEPRPGTAPLRHASPSKGGLRRLVMPQRMGALLLSLFSALALALATVGIYGVATYVASLRTREIGVRMALGATAQAVRRMILAQGARPVAAGILVGLGLALYASRLARDVPGRCLSVRSADVRAPPPRA